MNVNITYLGKAKITIDGQEIKSLSKKAECLILYMFIRKTENKLHLAEMFWGDQTTTEKAVHSLRNCLYKIRSVLGYDLFQKPSKDYISVHADAIITSDYHNYIDERTSSLTLASFDFLPYNQLSNNQLYNQWLEETQYEFRRIFLDHSIKELESYISLNILNKARLLGEQLLKVDEFDERFYMYLFNIHSKSNDTKSIIALYNSMCETYKRELSIAPNKQITDYVSTLIKNKASTRLPSPLPVERKSNSIIDRTDEFEAIQAACKNYLSGYSNRTILLQSDQGLGKTTLINHFIDSLPRECIVYKTQCYEAEKHFILKPWFRLIQSVANDYSDVINQLPLSSLVPIVTAFPFLRTKKMDELLEIDTLMMTDYQIIEREVTYFLNKIFANRKAIIIIEDIHWIDDISMSLIQNIIANNKDNPIQLLMSSNKVKTEQFSAFVSSLKEDLPMLTINLTPFNMAQTKSYAEEIFNLQLSSENLTLVYEDSAGNPYFIKEILHNFIETGDIKGLTANLKEVLALRTKALSQEERNLLDLLSVYYMKVRFNFLTSMNLFDEIYLVNQLESLVHKGLICEEQHGSHIEYFFSHRKIHEYIYSELSYAKKRILHEKSAKAYEALFESSPNKSLYYSKLIYHYQRANNSAKFIDYSIDYLYSYLCIAHEFFPVLKTDQNPILQLDRKYLDIHFDNIESWINILMPDDITTDYLINIAKYYHMACRYYIRMGDYQKGIQYIDALHALSISYDIDIKNRLRANRQLVCIYMNKYDYESLNTIINDSFQVIKRNDIENNAIWTRIQGYYKLMIKDYNKCRDLLNQSIQLFDSFDNTLKYMVNIAAAYNWIGESFRLEQKYVDAEPYYLQAIQLCESNGILGSTPIFYANYGQCLYDMNRILEAKDVCLKSLSLYTNTDSIWGKSIPHTYLALIESTEMHLDSAEQHLLKAEKYATQLGSSYELSLVQKAKDHLKIHTK